MSVKQLPPFLSLVDNSMFFFFPLAASLFNSPIFLALTTVFTSLRLLMVLKIRKSLTKYEMLKELLNKVIWVLYNLCYILLWARDEDPQIVKYGSIGVLLFLLIGIGEEVLFMGLDFLLFLF